MPHSPSHSIGSIRVGLCVWQQSHAIPQESHFLTKLALKEFALGLQPLAIPSAGPSHSPIPLLVASSYITGPAVQKLNVWFSALNCQCLAIALTHSKNGRACSADHFSESLFNVLNLQIQAFSKNEMHSLVSTCFNIFQHWGHDGLHGKPAEYMSGWMLDKSRSHPICVNVLGYYCTERYKQNDPDCKFEQAMQKGVKANCPLRHHVLLQKLQGGQSPIANRLHHHLWSKQFLEGPQGAICSSTSCQVKMTTLKIVQEDCMAWCCSHDTIAHEFEDPILVSLSEIDQTSNDFQSDNNINNQAVMLKFSWQVMIGRLRFESCHRPSQRAKSFALLSTALWGSPFSLDPSAINMNMQYVKEMQGAMYLQPSDESVAFASSKFSMPMSSSSVSEKEVPLIVSVSVSLSPSSESLSLSLSSESDTTESSVELVSEDSWLIWQAKGQGRRLP